MTERKYTCAACKEEFIAAWTEEEALAEMRSNFGNIKEECRAVVCDVCYRQMMGLPAVEEGELSHG